MENDYDIEVISLDEEQVILRFPLIGNQYEDIPPVTDGLVFSIDECKWIAEQMNMVIKFFEERKKDVE